MDRNISQNRTGDVSIRSPSFMTGGRNKWINEDKNRYAGLLASKGNIDETTLLVFSSKPAPSTLCLSRGQPHSFRV